MNACTSGVLKKRDWMRARGVNQSRRPTRLAKWYRTWKWKFTSETSSPTTSISRTSPTPSPRSWAMRMQSTSASGRSP